MAKSKDYLTKIKTQSIVDTTTGCWTWTAKSVHRQGYAFTRHEGTMKTVIRGLAIELNLFPHIDFNSRITNSCANKLCVNPDHIICLTHTEVNIRRYEKHGSIEQFSDNDALRVNEEYIGLKGELARVQTLAKKYDCSTASIYRTIERAKEQIVRSTLA